MLFSTVHSFLYLEDSLGQDAGAGQMESTGMSCCSPRFSLLRAVWLACISCSHRLISGGDFLYVVGWSRAVC